MKRACSSINTSSKTAASPRSLIRSCSQLEAEECVGLAGVSEETGKGAGIVAERKEKYSEAAAEIEMKDVLGQ